MKFSVFYIRLDTCLPSRKGPFCPADHVIAKSAGLTVFRGISGTVSLSHLAVNAGKSEEKVGTVNLGISQTGIEMLHVHIFLVAPLGASHMA